MAVETSNRSSTPVCGHSPVGFMSLPSEIRNKIYRLVFVTRRVIGEDSSWRRTRERESLQPQLLRTCRQVHDEAKAILYGENTFQITSHNTAGPSYGTIDISTVLSSTLSAKSKSNQPNPMLGMIRRFKIVIWYASEHNIGSMREDARWLAARLQRVPEIEFLELECALECRSDGETDWRSAGHDNYEHDGTSTEDLICMVKTCLGRVRNVKTAIVRGLPDEDADIIKERWLSSDSLEKLPLADRYEILEKHARGLGNKKRLANALRACEAEDEGEFNKLWIEITESMTRHLEALNAERQRWDSKDNDQEALEGS